MSAIDLGSRYEYVRELGQGGMGRVLLVRDTYLGKNLALKLFQDPLESAVELEQFQKEFALLTELKHPGIARAYDFGYLEGRPYFTSEFVPGTQLSAECVVGKIGELVEHFREIADALDFLHREGILHLDIKPSNIIVAAGHEATRAVLIDFGLFRRGFAVPPGSRLTGSLPYMAPEYFRQKPLGPWTDVYALGVTLYRITTGRFPRKGPRARSKDTADALSWDPAPQLPSQRCPGLPGDLDSIILRCLALAPESRFAHGGEVLESLNKIGVSSPLASQPAALTSVTVGRAEELRQIGRFLDTFVRLEEVPRSTANPIALLVTGPSGIGQSHLMREMKVRAQVRGLRFCLEIGYPGKSTPPGQLLRCLGSHMGRGESRSRSRWEAFLLRLRRPRRSLRNEVLEEERRLRWAAELTRAVGAIRAPLVLAVDGLQFEDEVSVELFLALVRHLGEREAGERPPIGIVVGYREEGPAVKLLRELTEYLLKEGRGQILTLRPLEMTEALDLYRRCGGSDLEESRALRLFQETGGWPAKVVAIAGAEEKGLKTPERLDETAVGVLPAGVGAKSRKLLLGLCLLRRPSSTAELSRVTEIPRSELERQLGELEKRHLIAKVSPRCGALEWIAGPAARGVVEAAKSSERSRLHRRIAQEVCRKVGGDEDPRRIEAVHHFRMAGNNAAVVKHGLLAARYLKSRFQNRAALDVYRAVLEALPENRNAKRLEVTFELAELMGRIGNLADGIRLLGEVLRRKRSLPRTQQVRTMLQLATLYSRSGEFRRAGSLFRQGFARIKKCRPPPSRQELLLYTNEYAAMKVFVGDHRGARRLCEEGLELARRSRSFRVQEMSLNLYATRANIALRSFDYAAAIRDFETALDIAEAIGSPSNRAIVLNNLGIVYSSSDRHREAIRAFQGAERISRPLDEGPSLVSIHGNLAILHGKTGDFPAMEKALGEVERLAPETFGRRQELFLQHARGTGLIHRGRYAKARSSLEAAILLAEAVGDSLIVAFDRVYRGEALLFEGRYSEARKELLELSGREMPGRIRKMALSRLALLEALMARPKEVERVSKKHENLEGERPVPFLDAWDDLFLGWASSIALLSSPGGPRGRGADSPGGSTSRLSRAQRYFSRHGLHPAASLCLWVLAESHFLEGGRDKAQKLLQYGRENESDLVAALAPLLGARILLADSPSPEERALCGDLLSKAGAALVGNPLPEWSLRLAALRAALRREDRKAEAEIKARRKTLSLEVPEEGRRSYLRSKYWRLWVSVLFSGRQRAERKSSGSGAEVTEPSTSTRTAPLRDNVTGTAHRDLVVHSPSMRRLVKTLDRLRKADLPVLIQGETGSGKETIARVIHDESRRAAAPFMVLDCTTIPGPLLESELFGARSGAFTDLDRDRPGILATAEGGTVFIDEVADLSLEVQAKLLRLLSQGSCRRLGDETETTIDVRFFFSTSRDLGLEVREGRLREDFLHRIQVLTVYVPPLRERPEDIPALFKRFLNEDQEPAPTVGRGVIECLRRLPWPGNIREFRNFVLRLKVECPDHIAPDSVARAVGDTDHRTLFSRNLLASEPLPELKRRVEREYILYHFERLQGDTEKLSRFLEISRQHLYKRCRQLGIQLWEARKKMKT